jgi:pyruvate dehydrogenase E1 component alpha subunit
LVNITYFLNFFWPYSPSKAIMMNNDSSEFYEFGGQMDYSQFNPVSDDPVSILCPDCTFLDGDGESLGGDKAVEAYRQMFFAREADIMAVSFQRQGRMFTYPPNMGQEAIAVAAGMVMKIDDWLVPSFRELGAWLARGVRLRDVFLFWRGHEDAFIYPDAPRVFPVAVPIASQIPHAAGLGYAIRKKQEDARVFTFVGDGGTSEGDFHEGMNFAAVWQAPLVCVIQNNQFAISVPREEQTNSRTLAAKALAYGMPGVRVDGNDLFAMYDVLRWARNYVGENGPVMIEAVTYRMGAHTTSDDPSKYRSKEQEEKWAQRDPLLRLENFLQAKKLIDPDQKDRWLDEFREIITKEFEAAENYGEYPLNDVFDHMYQDPPDDYEMQKREQQKFSAWLARRREAAS